MCGILGFVLAESVENPSGALPALAGDGLTSLQHRGTESAGLVGSNGQESAHFEIVKGAGLVRDVLTNEALQKLQDSVVLIGHNRYSTAGKKSGINTVQPFVVYTPIGQVAIAHNGELVDARRKRLDAMHQGVGLSTDTDSELIAQMIAKAIALNYKCRVPDESKGDIHKEVAVTMSAINMSYALIVMTYDRLYACRDPYGNRPLCIGTIFSKGAGAKKTELGYVVASESCAMPGSARYDHEVKPGEIVEISRKGVRSMFQLKPSDTPAFCIFEYVYFARGDTIFEGQQIQNVRQECGRILAEESPVDADVVSVVPDSAMAASIGYAEQAGIKYEQVLHRNSYVGRSFIQPSTELRQNAIFKKFGVLTNNVKGKRIVLIDDSIVRGNTMGILVKLLKEHGAKEVHLRIASPPVRYPCFMGINIPSRAELIAANESIEEITRQFNADSVCYLSVEGLKRAVQQGIARQQGYPVGHCTACLTGEYPVSIPDVEQF